MVGTFTGDYAECTNHEKILTTMSHVPATPTIINLATVVQVEVEGEVAGNGLGKVQAKGKE